jgi:hypothetical protein
MSTIVKIDPVTKLMVDLQESNSRLWGTLEVLLRR